MITQTQIEVVAKKVSETPLIDAPKLPPECWYGFARAILEAAEQELWQLINIDAKNGDDILLGCFGEHGHGMQFVAFWDDKAELDTHRWQTADGIAYHNDLPTHWQPLSKEPIAQR